MTRVMSLWFLLQSVGLMEGEEKVSECLDLVASAWAERDRVAEVFKDIASLWKLCRCPWLSPSAHDHLDFSSNVGCPGCWF